MDSAALLAQLDQERRSLVESGFRREAEARLTRHVPLISREGFISWSGFTPSELESAIDREIASFRGRVDRFEWKVYDHDQPAGLGEALQRHGFAPGEPETAMVANAQVLTEHSGGDLSPIRIIEFTEPEQFHAISQVEASVWGGDHTQFVASLAAEKRAQPERLRVFVAQNADVPVACAWLRMNPASRFAGLWGGSTVAEFRRKGIYRALLAARARIARDHGYAWLYVDASADSRPILERSGFERLTGTRPYLHEFS